MQNVNAIHLKSQKITKLFINGMKLFFVCRFRFSITLLINKLMGCNLFLINWLWFFVLKNHNFRTALFSLSLCLVSLIAYKGLLVEFIIYTFRIERVRIEIRWFCSISKAIMLFVIRTRAEHSCSETSSGQTYYEIGISCSPFAWHRPVCYYYTFQYSISDSCKSSVIKSNKLLELFSQLKLKTKNFRNSLKINKDSLEKMLFHWKSIHIVMN